MSNLNDRIHDLKKMIQEIESNAKPIHERVQRELHGSYELLKEEEKQLLESIKVKLSPLRKQLVLLKRSALTKEEKREIRSNLIGLAKKYHHEANNAVEGEYFELYLKIMDAIESQLNEKNDLIEINEYFDSKDFQMAIPEKYLNVMEQHSNLKELIDQIRAVIKKL
jgi:hypothetical protein